MIELINGQDNCKMLFTILDTLDEGVNIVDSKGMLAFSNKMSAEYVNSTSKEMFGHHISEFYPQAALINVLSTCKKIKYDKVRHSNGKIYMVEANPIYSSEKLVGGFAVFRDITEITILNDKLEKLELEHSDADEILTSIVGWNSSLYDTIRKAKKSIGALGGPRHSIITGESGTGKTALARSIYQYAKKIGVIAEEAPFVEVNCAQYTNSDIAAMEVFGSNEGAYTGAKDKKGLFELADGGILFLDEAHALDHYQNLLLKVLESGYVKRIGDIKDRKINVIVIAASTQNLNNVFLPELYQRLAQNELFLPPLRDRTVLEKYKLMELFVNKYQEAAKERYNIDLKVEFESDAQDILINYHYPRNIRQFRDVINASIDSAVPLISQNLIRSAVVAKVGLNNLPVEVQENNTTPALESTQAIKQTQSQFNKTVEKNAVLDEIRDIKYVDNLIEELSKNKLGPRKIANILNRNGIDIKYYQVAYKLNKLKEKDK